jgi:hypothetical protein
MYRNQLKRTRKVFLFLLGAAVSGSPAEPQTPVTVAQLRQYLSSKQVSKASDVEVADRLGSVLLTEQLTSMTLNEIQAKMALGPKASEQLALLAAESALKVPPVNELPSLVQPDPGSQRQIAGRAIAYVDQTLDHLPDFLATRVTISFDDTPRTVSKGSNPKAILHFARETHREIAYRNHQEQSTVGADNLQSFQDAFSTWGEFGPVLNMVLRDTFKDSLIWDRWQKDQDGRVVAVYRYAVPRAASHYAIDLCCYPVHFHDQPGYHGEMYINPSTGAIDRITAEPEYEDNSPIESSGIAIQYSRVDIGGQIYVCPTNSIAISAIRTPDPTSDHGFVKTKFLNVVRFVNYHKFGSSSRIVSSGESKPD